MDQITKIKDLLKQGLVVPIVGAGVSYATAGLPGWKGLIDSGLNYAENAKADPNVISEARKLLNENKLIQSATLVKELLNAPGRPFSNWLNEILGRPKIKSSLLIESIQNLCQPIIATTNYDDLLRNVGAVQTDLALDWKQHEEIQSCLYSHRQFILHLHGIYLRPDTPIFGEDDYRKLKGQTGYKTILSQLWMQRHFLFIGCSKDGVMDEDFTTVLELMRDWFPGIQNEHFIFMLEDELGSANHWQLMKECNVHAVPLGKTYDDLSTFINKINPNVEEIARRFEQRKSLAYNGVKAILEAQPEIEIPMSVSNLIVETLGVSYYWVENDRLKIFEEALKNYNLQLHSKGQRFSNWQIVTRALINVSDLQSKIAAWAPTKQNIAAINNHEFINMGILAYRCLESCPPEMLEDIRLRHRYVIHPYYFTGYLRGFYDKAIRWKGHSGDTHIFESDDYFFENLRRIMDSLMGVLSLIPDELYDETEPAKIAKILPEEFLLFVSDKTITLRRSVLPYEIIAELPWDANLEFGDAELISLKNKKIVVGFSAQHAFYWNPLDELTATNFYTSRQGDDISNLIIVSQGEDVVVDIYTDKSRITIANFDTLVETKLAGSFSGYVFLKDLHKTFCCTEASIGTRGNCIFEFNALGEYEPRLSTIELWEQVKEIREVRAMFEQYKKDNDIIDEMEDSFYPFVVDVLLATVKWKIKDLLVIRFRIVSSDPDSVILLFIDPIAGFDKPVLKMLFPNKNCFSYDTILVDGHINFIAGYLDFGDVGDLIQYFEEIDLHDLVVSNNQPGIVAQDKLTRVKTRDMFRVTFAKPERVFVIEEGTTLHDIELPGLKNTETKIEDGIKSVYFYG